LLLVSAGLATIGFGSAAESALAAAKTYTACKTTDVKVGGMKRVKVAGKQLLITQPRKGVFRAFDATCTHQGCAVSQLLGNKLVCSCHGGQFNFDTGAAAGGPVLRGLTKIKVSVAKTAVKVTL
jgi:nitrite reductase/ring-hydroxylating ferredoxin subunit